MFVAELRKEDKLPLAVATKLEVVDKLVVVAEFMANKIEAKSSFEEELIGLELIKAFITECKSKVSLKELLEELLKACFEEE